MFGRQDDGYSPKLLPDVTAVEVVVLGELDVRDVGTYMSAAATTAAARVRVEGEQARRLAGLWRGLRSGDQMRCHVPPFGFRFFVGNELVCEASVCWRCNNIYGVAGGADIHYEFDAEDSPATALLDEARRLTGVDSKG